MQERLAGKRWIHCHKYSLPGPPTGEYRAVHFSSDRRTGDIRLTQLNRSNERENASMKTPESAVSPVGAFFRRLLQQRFALSSLMVCMLFLGIAVYGEAYSIYCNMHRIEPIYNREHPEIRNMPPSREHWLGTDYLGRDVLCRAFFATRTAVKVGLVASLISAVVGVGLGLAAGYYGGIMDDIAVWVYSTFASMPTLLFILAFSLLVSKGFLFAPLDAVFQSMASALNTEPGMMAVYLGIGLTGWVALCKVVRAETMRLREMQYVTAAKSLGVSNFRIMMRHILPNLMHLVIIYFTMRFAFAIMTEVIVSYLGMGVQFEPSWGVMISSGQGQLWRGIWWEVGAATGFMFILVLALNLLGDALRDALDPRLKM